MKNIPIFFSLSNIERPVVIPQLGLEPSYIKANIVVFIAVNKKLKIFSQKNFFSKKYYIFSISTTDL